MIEHLEVGATRDSHAGNFWRRSRNFLRIHPVDYIQSRQVRCGNSEFRVGFLFNMGILLFSVHVSSAYGQIIDYSVENAAASLRKEYETALSKTEGSMSRSMFEARTNVLVVLGHIDMLAEKHRGKIVKDLEATQRQIFIDSQDLVRQIDSGPLKRAQEIADAAENALSGLSGSTPRIRGWQPAYAIAQSAIQTVSVTGNFLDHGPAILKLAGKQCETSLQITNKLEFRCELPASAPIRGHFMSGELILSMERGWWQRLTFQAPPQRTLPVGITLVGRSLGQLTVLAIGKRNEKTLVPRSQRIGHRNNHCSGDFDMTTSFNPQSANCEIDVNSISVAEHSRSSNSVNAGLRNVSSTGFQWVGIARNNGRCGPKVFGQPVGLDGRGWVEVNVSWQEACSSSSPFEHQVVVNRDVLWSESFQLEVPIGTESLRWSISSPFSSDTGTDNKPGRYFKSVGIVGESNPAAHFEVLSIAEALK